MNFHTQRGVSEQWSVFDNRYGIPVGVFVDEATAARCAIERCLLVAYKYRLYSGEEGADGLRHTEYGQSWLRDITDQFGPDGCCDYYNREHRHERNLSHGMTAIGACLTDAHWKFIRIIRALAKAFPKMSPTNVVDHMRPFAFETVTIMSDLFFTFINIRSDRMIRDDIWRTTSFDEEYERYPNREADREAANIAEHINYY